MPRKKERERAFSSQIPSPDKKRLNRGQERLAQRTDAILGTSTP
jgi:hypothetical protein